MNAAFQVGKAALFGALWGSLLFGAVGVVLSIGLDLLFAQSTHPPEGAGLRLLLGAVPPVALFLAGAFIVALRQGVAQLVELFVKHEITGRLYARVRPAVHATALKLKSASGPLTNRSAVRSVRAAIEERRNAEAPASRKRERLLRTAIAQAEGSLAALLLLDDGKLPPRDQLVEHVESVGVERFEALVAELFERIYTAQLTMALLVAVTACALPYLIYGGVTAISGPIGVLTH